MAREFPLKVPASGAVLPERTRGGRTYAPPVDIVETENELLVFADMPGVKPEDIDIRFDNGELVIHGKVEPPEGRDYLLQEYGLGDYYRTFMVYESVDADHIEATYKDGVLTVRLPKAAEARPKKIAVKTE